MHYKEMSPEEYMETCHKLFSLGWLPCVAMGEMLFLRNGKIYDLSAADLSQLDRIEREGLFLVSP